ncbi:MAG: AI-2E family transporter [Alphaproteobacteria bacterium]|nr:AI-2E family transporter [Alphaproteobacteria bacterium]
MADQHRAAGGSDTTLRRALIVLAVVAVALLAWTWRHVLLLVFAAAVISVGLRGLANPIARRTPLGPAGSLALVVVLFLAAVIGLFWMFGAQISAQTDDLAARLPQAWSDLRTYLMQAPFGPAAVQQMEQFLARRGDGAAISDVIANLGNVTLSFVNAAVDTFVVLVAAIFFAASPRSYIDGALVLLPRGLRPDVSDAMRASAVALRKWMQGTLISMATIAVLVGVTFWALKVPAFLALALIAGAAQIVPLVGPFVAMIPAALLALTVSPQTALWAVIGYTIASQLEANVIYPLVQRRAVSMPPAVTLFVVLAMGLLFGPLGVLLALPIAVVMATFIIKLYVNKVLGESLPAPGA